MNSSLPRQNESHPELKLNEFDLIPFQSTLHNAVDIYRGNSNRRLRTSVLAIFTILSSLIFFVACFNLANSSIAMIANRLKEIGIRKTLGSENHKIMIQFLIEMGIVYGLALIIGLAMVNMVSGAVLGLFGAFFPIQDVSLGAIILFLILFLSFTTLVAGIMPALYAWKFQPIEIMRKKARLRGVGWLNKTLTVAQYVFSIAVLSTAFTFSSNVEFLENLDPGYANDNVYVLEFEDKKDYLPVKQQVDQMAGVTTTGTHNHIQIAWKSGRTQVLQIDTSSYELRTLEVDENYLDVMNVPVTLGRTFIQDSEAEVNNSIIVNQEFVKRYFQNESPLNKTVKVAGENKTIVGVTANLIQDVYEDAEDIPMAFTPRNDESYRYLIAKVENVEKGDIEGKMKQIWAESVDMPFNGNWQEDLAYGSALRDTENLRIIFLWMAILGCFLSIAGIFSLSKLNIAKRIKEISIRKVLGSTINQLLVTVNKPFIIVLSISILLGSLLGYLIADKTLAMIYKYYVSVSPLTSLLCGIFIGASAVVMIVFSILPPAKANPVKGLRQE